MENYTIIVSIISQMYSNCICELQFAVYPNKTEFIFGLVMVFHFNEILEYV